MSRLEFYEEITPLVVAAEYGACEVIKVGSERSVDSVAWCMAWHVQKTMNLKAHVMWLEFT